MRNLAVKFLKFVTTAIKGIKNVKYVIKYTSCYCI